MTKLEATITITNNSLANKFFELHITSPINTYDTTIPYVFDTVAGATNPAYKVVIGSTIAESTTNLYNKIASNYSAYSFIEVIQLDTDKVKITIYDTDATALIGTNSGLGTRFTLTTETVAVLDNTTTPFTIDNIILSRSPYWVTLVPPSLFDSAILELKIYRGTYVTDLPTTPQYTLSKLVIQAGQTDISFEISKYINDYCKSNIPTITDGVNTSTAYDSVWLEAKITAYYLGTVIGSQTNSYYAIDGFGYHTELYNPLLTKKVLSTINNHTIYNDSKYPLYFVTKDLSSITINGTSVGFTLDETINSQLISYVNVSTYKGSSTSFSAVFVYATETITHNFTVKSECRFPLYNCFFKNKYGFWQSIPFNLRNKQTIDVTSSDYMPIISRNGIYSLQSHQTKTFLPEAKDKITVNTDYISEEYNALFDELMLSEFVYLENNDNFLPVNLVTKSLQRKTRLFDKMIQYTIDFEYSFNKMNTVN